PWERAHRGIGRTFQITRLFGEMTVLENVVAPLRAFRWGQLNAGAMSGPEAARAEELLDFVGMRGFRDQRARALSYGQQKGVDLEVPTGAIACIVGPNGAGKSTVLRTVSGLLKPRAGDIELDGTPLHTATPAEILRHGVVQVPQADALFPNLTVRDNVLMGAYLLRRDRALVRRRYDR